MPFTGAPRIKNKPNAQGTLFQGGADQMTDKARYPRGYTPDRMNNVRDQVQVRSVNWGLGDQQARQNGGQYNPLHNPWSPGHTAQLVHEPLARSSMTGAQMRGMSVEVHAQPHDRGKGLLGQYDSMTKKVSIYPHPNHDDEGADNDMASSTLLHEAGHHADVAANIGTYHRRLVEEGEPLDAGMRGEMETAADTHMVNNFAPHPARPGFDVQKETYGQRGVAINIAGGGYTDPSTHASGTSPSSYLQSKQFTGWDKATSGGNQGELF
jgi:hypothetical protein